MMINMKRGLVYNCMSIDQCVAHVFFSERIPKKKLMFAASSCRLFVGSPSANFKSEETKNVENLFEVDSSRLPSDPSSDDETQKHSITSDLADKEDKKSDKKRSVKSSFGGKNTHAGIFTSLCYKKI